MSSQAGKGLYPPNPTQWDNERHGLALRGELGLSLDCILEPETAFAAVPGTTVLPHGALSIDGAAVDFVSHFRGPGKGSWSGAAFPLPDGTYCVVYNDAHPRTRVRATLMEEYFHLRLGHPATRVRILDGEPGRTHDPGAEAEAFGSGAAALVPYKTLKSLHLAGENDESIGRTFGVSRQLVQYRLRVTRLLRRANR